MTTCSDNNALCSRDSSDYQKIISIIIVSYKTKELLQACLTSISRELQESHEVIVSDNGSDDGSTEMIEKEFPFVQLIKNNRNYGFAKANNIAYRRASGKYVLLLNPDTELTGSTLGRLISYMDCNPQVSAAGCKILYPDGSFQFSCGYLPSIFTAIMGGVAVNNLFRRIFPNKNLPGASGLPPQSLPNVTHEVETLQGASVILRKDVIDKIGLFDEKMFMYFEECDLFLRMLQHGGKIMYITDTEIIHHAGASTKSLAKSVSYYQESLEYYLIKNFQMKRVKAFRLILMISALVKYLLLTAIYLFAPGKSKERMKYKIGWHQHTYLHLLKSFFQSNKQLRSCK